MEEKLKGVYRMVYATFNVWALISDRIQRILIFFRSSLPTHQLYNSHEWIELNRFSVVYCDCSPNDEANGECVEIKVHQTTEK